MDKRGRPADVVYMTDCALQHGDREREGSEGDCDGAGNVPMHGALGRGGERTSVNLGEEVGLHVEESGHEEEDRH